MRRIALLSLVPLLLLPAGPEPARGRGLNDGYVGCSWSDDCYPFDLQTFAVGPSIDILPEGDYPYDAVMDFDGGEIWIPGASGDGIVVIDRATDTVSHRIAVGEYLVGFCFGADGSFGLASSRDHDGIYQVSTESYTTEGFLPVGGQPGNLALDPVSERIYAVEWFDGRLFEISSDGTTLLNAVPIGASLWQLVVDPSGEHIYVTDRGTDQVRVIEQATLTEVDNLAVGDDPWGLDITSDGTKLVVTCEDSHDVYILEVGTWTTTVISLGAADPRDVDILDRERLAFVCSGDVGSPDSIYVFDLVDDQLVTAFPIPGGSNPNVISVQPQMHGDSGRIDGPHQAPRLALVLGPNPCAGPAEIRYRTAEAGPVELALFDAAGRRRATLRSGSAAAGVHLLRWDGRDGRGRVLPRGAYWLRLRSGGESRTVPAILFE